MFEFALFLRPVTNEGIKGGKSNIYSKTVDSLKKVLFLIGKTEIQKKYAKADFNLIAYLFMCL